MSLLLLLLLLLHADEEKLREQEENKGDGESEKRQVAPEGVAVAVDVDVGTPSSAAEPTKPPSELFVSASSDRALESTGAPLRPDPRASRPSIWNKLEGTRREMDGKRAPRRKKEQRANDGRVPQF